MHRIDTEGSVGGEFSEGTPPTIPATVVGADWLNDLQGNVVQVIEDTGASLVKGLYSQLKTAVVWYVDAGIAALKAAVNTWTAQNTFAEGGIFSRTTANTNAVGATGNGTGYGVEATGGAGGGAGVRGTGGGVGPGVIGRSLGSGDGLIGDASGGTGNGVFAAGNATKGPIRTQSQGTPPTDAAISSIYSDTAGHHFAGNGTVWYPIGSGTAEHQTNSVGNDITVETNFHIAQIPANRLAATPVLKVTAVGEIFNSAASKTFRFYVGGNLILACGFPGTTDGRYFFDAIVARSGANQQRITAKCILIEAVGVDRLQEGYEAIVNLTLAENATIEIKTTGQDGTAINQIIEHMFLTEYP